MPGQGPGTGVAVFHFDVFIRGLNKLLMHNVEALRRLENNTEQNPITRMQAKVTRKLLDDAMGRSPYLYGVLHRAHRGEFEDWETSKIFIDPIVVHPILGGKPVEYGAVLHREVRPWFVHTAKYDAPKHLKAESARFVIEIEDMYK